MSRTYDLTTPHEPSPRLAAPQQFDIRDHVPAVRLAWYTVIGLLALIVLAAS